MSNARGIMIRPIRPSELAPASALCLRSKAYWGYDKAFIDACREELTLTPDDIASSILSIVTRKGTPVGVAQLCVEGSEADLEKLFVDPEAIGMGVGRLLFDWSKETAKRTGAVALTVTADPFAAAFYEKMGFTFVGDEPSSSIPDRTLPLYRMRL